MTTDRATDTETTYVDRVLREVQVGVTHGLDLDRGAQTAGDLMAAVGAMATALKGVDYTADRDRTVTCPSCKAKHVVKTPIDPDAVARAMAHAQKAQDTLVRLMEFAAGRPDSRPDSSADWIRYLTDDELKTIQARIEAAKTADPDPRGGRR